MILDITMKVDSNSPSDLNALAALIASLGGRAPGQGVTHVVNEVRPTAAAIVEQDRGGWSTVPAEPSLADDHSEQDAEIVDAAVAAGAPSVDSKGIPWDARIHSESRATVADGTWRKRRNVDEAIYASVLAELSGAPNAPADDAPEPPAGNTAGDASADVPNAPGTTAPEPVATAPEVAAAVGASDSAPMTFPQFVQAVQGAPVPDAAKAYTALNHLAATLGVGAFKDMKDHADKFDMFLGMLG